MPVKLLTFSLKYKLFSYHTTVVDYQFLFVHISRMCIMTKTVHCRPSSVHDIFHHIKFGRLQIRLCSFTCVQVSSLLFHFLYYPSVFTLSTSKCEISRLFLFWYLNRTFEILCIQHAFTLPPSPETRFQLFHFWRNTLIYACCFFATGIYPARSVVKVLSARRQTWPGFGLFIVTDINYWQGFELLQT